MKILHTADWHIGLKASRLGGAGARVRGERLRSARRVIDIANERGVDIVLLAGDTFDDNNVGASAIKEVAAILETSAAPVCVIPGNHDYLCPGSVWDFDEWGRSGKIHLLTEETPVEIGGAVIYPCPLREYESMESPTAWIPEERASDGKIRIALAHGSVEGLPKEELDIPIPRDLPARKNLDYAALGHWHSYSLYESGGACRMAYSGSHETTRFGKPDSFCAAAVTIDGAGAVPQIERLNIGALTWIDREETIDGAAALRAVAESILGIENQESTLVRLKLSGVYTIDDIGALDELRAIGEAGRFLFFEVLTDELSLVRGDISTDMGWINVIGEILVRKTGERIAATLTDAGRADTFSSSQLLDKTLKTLDKNLVNSTNQPELFSEIDKPDRAVSERALLELYMICKEARR
jgi:DNA repair exonuclease SbcCD nuclease subunit